MLRSVIRWVLHMSDIFSGFWTSIAASFCSIISCLCFHETSGTSEDISSGENYDVQTLEEVIRFWTVSSCNSKKYLCRNFISAYLFMFVLFVYDFQVRPKHQIGEVLMIFATKYFLRKKPYCDILYHFSYIWRSVSTSQCMYIRSIFLLSLFSWMAITLYY